MSSPLRGVMVEIRVPLSVRTLPNTTSPSSPLVPFLSAVAATLFLPRREHQCTMREEEAGEAVEAYSVNLKCSNPGAPRPLIHSPSLPSYFT